MKILFCSHNQPIKELGASKMILELTEELQRMDCECLIISREVVLNASDNRARGYAYALRQYFLKHAAECDVVDYDHLYLPYPREEFAPRTLFVARSVLLRHHFLRITIPRRRFLKSRLRQWSYGRWLDHWREMRLVREARRTTEQADLVLILNEEDERALLETGLPRNKIAVLPHGLTTIQMRALHAIPEEPPAMPRVIIVATFDARKGAVEMPALLERIWRAVPGVQFRLIGTRRDPHVVLASFLKEMHPVIEVIQQYGQDVLPALLAEGSVGIFPSYIEGFPIGVLEMMAAAVPVIAYDAPGAPMMVPRECLVERGNYHRLAEKVVPLLLDPAVLAQARRDARERSAQFTMEEVASRTKALYAERLGRLRSPTSVA